MVGLMNSTWAAMYPQLVRVLVQVRLLYRKVSLQSLRTRWLTVQVDRGGMKLDLRVQVQVALVLLLLLLLLVAERLLG